MRTFNLQSAILLVIFGLAATASSAAPDSTSIPAPRSQSDNQNADDNEDADDWVFDSGPYTESPKTGERVWQYAQEKPVYSNTPNSYSIMPYYSSSDPFFLPSTDRMFFLNTPDPFYAEPTSYPIFYNGTIGAHDYFYGLESGGYNP
jgi:hypothetical protein